MAIEAKGLSFAYPGSKKRVLHDINLSLKPGQVLAVVGSNGGGKTTLIKVLMGLYDYEGDLFFNGQQARLIDPASVHRRTSCLFQDFSKYALTLRENVAIGNLCNINKDASITLALQRGGAQVVANKYGLDTRLSTTTTPTTAELGMVDEEVEDKARRAAKAQAEDEMATAEANMRTSREKQDLIQINESGDEPHIAQHCGDSEGISGERERDTDSCPNHSPEVEEGIRGDEIPLLVHNAFKPKSMECEPDDVKCQESPQSYVDDPGTNETTDQSSTINPPETEMKVVTKLEKVNKAKTAKINKEVVQVSKGSKLKGSKAKPIIAGLSGGQWQRVALSRAFMRSEEADLVVFE